MAAESFHESLILENKEQLRILEKLIDEADAKPPSKYSSDVLSEIKMGKKTY